MSSVEFTGPNGEPLLDDSSVGDAAWHGGFDMTLDGKQVRRKYIARQQGPGFVSIGAVHRCHFPQPTLEPRGRTVMGPS